MWCNVLRLLQSTRSRETLTKPMQARRGACRRGVNTRYVGCRALDSISLRAIYVQRQRWGPAATSAFDDLELELFAIGGELDAQRCGRGKGGIARRPKDHTKAFTLFSGELQTPYGLL